jgi:ATP-dependent protease Clp ATPase subunit
MARFKLRLRRLACSFCRRKDADVEKLVAGGGGVFGRAYICDRCVAIAAGLMDAKESH